MKLLRKTKSRLKNKLGLTLVELMIVIAIIGILTAIFVPQVMQHYNLQWVW